MILGELPFFKDKIQENKLPVTVKKIGLHIELSRLEVVQVFHVSYSKNRDSILRFGLLPKGKCDGYIISYEPRIFVSTTYKEAAFDYVHFEEVDVWTFYLPKRMLHPDEFSDFANHYYTKEPVPWHKLTLFESR